jgi:transcriptional regulator with XRE-family HTH domain
MKSQAKNTASPYSPGLWDRIVEVLGTERTGQIAKTLGLSPSSVSDWKHGRTTPGIETVGDIAFYGNTTVEYLIYGNTEQRHRPGDTTYFETAFLPADYEARLKTLADEAGQPVKVFAQGLLIWAIDRRTRPSFDELLDNRLRQMLKDQSESQEPIQDVGTVDEFLAAAIRKYDNALPVLRDWYAHDNVVVELPQTLAFQGWDRMTLEQKVREIRGAREIMDHTRYLKERHEASTKSHDT